MSPHARRSVAVALVLDACGGDGRSTSDTTRADVTTGAPDSDVSACVTGLYCSDEAADAAGIVTCAVCLRLPVSGEPCARFGQCAEGLYCDGSGATPTCTDRLGDGAPYVDHDACRSAFCQPDQQLCDGGGHVGEPCATGADCRTRLCDGHACVEYRSNGASCTEDGQCRAGACLSGRCGKPLGATCQYDSECADRCDEALGSCVAALADGVQCGDSTDCASGFCDPWQQLCREYCNTDADCQNGQFCD